MRTNDLASSEKSNLVQVGNLLKAFHDICLFIPETERISLAEKHFGKRERKQIYDCLENYVVIFFCNLLGENFSKKTTTLHVASLALPEYSGFQSFGNYQYVYDVIKQTDTSDSKENAKGLCDFYCDVRSKLNSCSISPAILDCIFAQLRDWFFVILAMCIIEKEVTEEELINLFNWINLMDDCLNENHLFESNPSHLNLLYTQYSCRFFSSMRCVVEEPPTVVSTPAVDNVGENLDSLLQDLNSMVGLSKVKAEIQELIAFVKINQMRKVMGLPVESGYSLHLVFEGNPGTGKTTVARKISQIYKALGLLSKGHLVEVDRAGLVAQFVGQTAPQTKKKIEEAIGGVLFIDEAYSLSKTDGSGNDFGQEAIDTLNKEMEDHRNDLVVIVAGYSDKMQDFLKANPGLKSRFGKSIHFEDYSPEEMMSIFKIRCEKGKYVLEDKAEKLLCSVFNKIREMGENEFGNARGVRKLFEKIVVKQSGRIRPISNPTRDELSFICYEDVYRALMDEELLKDGTGC